MPEPKFTLSLPDEWTSNVIFASPHSGRHYPDEFIGSSTLSYRQLRSSEDAFVDQLFAGAREAGSPYLCANYPRAFVDLNRSRQELDSALIRGAAHHKSSQRVAAGLGVIPRVVAASQVIRRGKISLEEAEGRLKLAYDPYHEELSDLLKQGRRLFGSVTLIDCHSMPHAAHSKMRHKGGAVPDIVLGDRNGTSCAPHLVDLAENILTDLGFTVARNHPFAGAYIAEHYGQPQSGTNVLQIELDRRLYLNENTIRKTAAFSATKERLFRFVTRFCAANNCALSTAAE